jgi:hypothetical protein
MPKHKDFARVYHAFVKTYGATRARKLYFAWLRARGYDDKVSFRVNLRRVQRLAK